MNSNQTVDLDTAVSMKNATSGNINERFSSTHYAKLMQFSPDEARKYILQFQPEEEAVEVKSEAPTNFEPVEKPIVEENTVKEEDIKIELPEAMKQSISMMTDAEEKEVLAAQLRAAGVHLASSKWKLETLRSKVSLLPN